MAAMRSPALQAASAADLPAEIAYRLMSVMALQDELEALRKALATPAPKKRPELEDDEWSDAINRLTPALGDCPETGIPAARGVWSTETDRVRQSFAFQLGRARRALSYGRNLAGSDYHNTNAVLLPARFDQRFEFLLGRGELPMAWIFRLDLLKF